MEELEKNPILEPAEIVEEVQNATDSEGVNNEDWEDDYEPANIYEPKRDKKNLPIPCLLYTSDAADDTPCVDLGGRRII